MVAPIGILSLFALSISLATPAIAPDAYVYYAARFTATSNGTHVTVAIRINDAGISAPIDHLAILRRPHGSCEAPVRINETPIVFQPDTLTSVNYVDTEVEVGRTYEYHLAAFDAVGSPVDMQWGWGWPFRAWTSVGLAPITHGQLGGPTFIGGYAVATCEEECYYDCCWYLQLSPELLPYVNTGIRLALYGQFTQLLPQFGWAFTMTSAQPQDCTVTIAPISWSGAKSIYRE